MRRMGEIRQRYGVQCATDGAVDFLPCIANRAAILEFALAIGHAALGNAEGAFQYIDDFCRTDVLRQARQCVAAFCTAQRVHQISTREDLEQLLYGRQRNTSAVRDIVGRADLAPLRCEVDEDHRAVVRQFTDAKHMGPS